MRVCATHAWPLFIIAERNSSGIDGLEVGVVEDDGSGLAAQLERAARAFSAEGADVAAGRGRPGEADLVDAGVGDEVLARPTSGGDDVDDAGREAGLVDDLGQHESLERRLGRRLQHDRRAGGQRWGHLEHEDEQRARSTG